MSNHVNLKLLALALVLSASGAVAQEAGTVTFATGAVTAERTS